MPIYACEKCNYSSKNKSDHAKHIKTKKHLQRFIIKQYTSKNTSIIPSAISQKVKNNIKNNIKYEKLSMTKCDFCDEVYTRSDSLKRHMKKCAKKILNDQSITFKNELEMKNQELKKKNFIIKIKNEKIALYEETLKNYENELIHYRKLFQTAHTVQNIKNNREI
jgi:uncharacterized C2H2 Zn-finger protein